MFKKKLIALGLTAVMIASLAACGGEKKESTSDSNTTPAASSDSNKPAGGDSESDKNSEGGIQSAAEDHSAISADCIVSFEDGNFAFAKLNETDWTRDPGSELSVVDAFGSKALQITRPNNLAPCVAIDVTGLLGAENAAKVKKVSMDIGLLNADGFSAASGQVIAAYKQDYSYEEEKTNVLGETTVETITGTNELELATDFSIYKDTAACKTISFELEEGGYFDNSNCYITFGSLEDTGATPSNVVVDNIIFYDAAGNALPVDSSATFAVEGVGEFDWSNMVKQPIDEKLLLTGVATDSSNEWWPLASNAWCFRPALEGEGGANADVTYFDLANFGPGDLITVYYKLNADMEDWQKQPRMIVQYWKTADADGNPIEDPVTIAESSIGFLPKGLCDDNGPMQNRDDDGTAAADCYVNESNTIAQFTYEQFLDQARLQAFSDSDDYLKYIPFAGIAANGANLKIKAVTIGKDANN